MEKYIRDITQCKIPECSVIVSSANVVEKDYGTSIVLIPDYFRSCPSVTELVNALSKRLHTQQLCSIAIGCICSYGYTLNHTNISAYQSKTFMSIWGHLETLKKSSSVSLSQWLSACLGRRSQEGYNFRFSDENATHATDSSVPILTSRKKFNVKVEPVGMMFSEKYFGEASTVRDAMMADAKMLSAIKFVFNEPVLNNDTITYGQQE